MNLKKILPLMIVPAFGLLLMTVPLAFLVRSVVSPDVLKTDGPGIAVFEVKKPGTYSVWRKTAGVVDDSEFRSDSPDMPEGLSITIQRNDDASTVSLEEYLGVTSTSGGSSRHSLVKAELLPGKYNLTSQAINPVSLVVRQNPIEAKHFFFVMACAAVGFLLLMGGMLYAGIVIIRAAIKKPVSELPEA